MPLEQRVAVQSVFSGFVDPYQSFVIEMTPEMQELLLFSMFLFFHPSYVIFNRRLASGYPFILIFWAEREN